MGRHGLRNKLLNLIMLVVVMMMVVHLQRISNCNDMNVFAILLRLPLLFHQFTHSIVETSELLLRRDVLA